MLVVDVQQDALEDTQQLPQTLLDKTVRVTEDALDLKRGGTISVAFVSEDEIRALNKKFRGKDAVTDVLSFPLQPSETTQETASSGQSPTTIGEVLVCYAQAARQAKQVGHSTQDEVVFLLVHGILHVFGYDHMEEEEKAEMFDLQDRILSQLDIESHL